MNVIYYSLIHKLQICFWLIENNLRVLIAACDTFRAGAVEQLRTHTHHLNALHPSERHGGQQMVQLYEKGYGRLGNCLRFWFLMAVNIKIIDAVRDIILPYLLLLHHQEFNSVP